MPESGRLVILDRLRFVNDNKAEMLVLERLHRAAKAAVGREHNVPRRLRQITLGAVEERYRQVRCKPRDLTVGTTTSTCLTSNSPSRRSFSSTVMT